MAEWRVYEADTPQRTSSGTWMPFARYQCGQGVNARTITDYCPYCGGKMTAMPMCGECKYGQGAWKDNGICYACREQFEKDVANKRGVVVVAPHKRK